MQQLECDMCPSCNDKAYKFRDCLVCNRRATVIHPVDLAGAVGLFLALAAVCGWIEVLR